MNDHQSELIEIASKLIGFKTVSPMGNEAQCAPYISSIMKAIGMKVIILAKLKNRANVIGEIGSGKKSIVIACHIDTVELGKNWKVTKPLKPLVKNGRIYGRGAVDDKGPFAVAYCAVKDFINDHPHFDGKIYLVAMADEENDNVYGVKFLLEKGFEADAGLIPDGGYFNAFDYGEKGCLQLKIESFGKQEHSALQENGKNAVENLIHLIDALKKNLVFEHVDERFTALHSNVSRFHGGDMPNTIPAEAWAQMDIRYPLGNSSKDVWNKIQETTKQSKGKFKLSVLYRTEPHVVSDQDLIEAFKKAAKKAKIPMEPITIGGNSVAKEFTQAGIQSIVHIPAGAYTAHEPDEYIEIDKMEKAVTLYKSFLEEYFSVSLNRRTLSW